MSDRAVEPKVTVVIPTRNRHAQILRCLDSLAHQTFRDFEVIVVNDGSTDETRKVLDDFLKGVSHLNLRVVHHDTPRGANASRNEAIRTGRATLFAFLDDDCTAEPQWLENLQTPCVHDVVAAVSGHVENVALSNIWERFFIGQHRVTSREVKGIRVANRIVAGNLLVRAQFLPNALDEDRAQVPVDVATSARGDEEGLRIKIRRAGKLLAHAPDAICLHNHPYSFHSFCRQAFNSGQSSARLAVKYRLAPRWELLALLMSVLLICFAWWRIELTIISAFSFCLFLAAVLYNEFFLKSKTVGQTIQTFPALVWYYALRTAGYVTVHIPAFRR